MFDDLISEADNEGLQYLQLLLDKDNIELITDTHLGAIKAILKLKLFSKFLQNKENSFAALESITDLYLQLMVSNKRKSRNELVEALKHVLHEQDEEQNSLAKQLK